jgi:hypothetical protein
MLAARLVGPSGEVVGVERDSHSIKRARARVTKAGLHNVSFTECDVSEVRSPKPFDAALGRFILQRVPDPVAVLRCLSQLVRPGGVHDQICPALACRKSMEPPLWALSRSFLTGAAAAGGFALINSMATFGGFVGPTLLGVLLKATGGYHTAFVVLAALDASVAVLILRLRHTSGRAGTPALGMSAPQ